MTEYEMELDIWRRVAKNWAAGCKKPLAYTLAIKGGRGAVKAFEDRAYWTLRLARQALRDKKKLVGPDVKLVVAEIWMFPKKTKVKTKKRK